MPVFFDQSVDSELTYERVESFGNGMDLFTRSTLLPPDGWQFGLNTLVPDGLEVRTRFGADSLFDSLGSPIQGLLYFDTPSVEQLINVGNAKVYAWNGTTNTEITGWVPSSVNAQMSMAQGLDTVLMTDGTARSNATTGGIRIYNGTTFVDPGNAANDPPETASIFLYHAGRMWAAGFPGSQAGKEADALWGSELLSFGQGQWSGTDRNIRIGAGEGDPIKGLASISSNTDSGFFMAILKENSIVVMNTDPTQNFTQFTANLKPQKIPGLGTVGKRSFCVDGNDLLFIAPDKSIRSLARMEAAEKQFQLGPDIGLPIKPYVKRINWSYAHLSVVKKYGELVIFSVPLDSATTPNTQFVWNSRLQRWVGIWTLITAQDMEVTRFSGVHRLIFGDVAGKVLQWKDYASETTTSSYQDDGADIPTKLWTRSFLFGEPLNDKDAFYTEVSFGTSNCNSVQISLIGDNALLKTWTENVAPQGLTFPIVFPVIMPSPVYSNKRKGLRGLTPFNECYLKIETTGGFISVRTVSLSAFLNTLKSA